MNRDSVIVDGTNFSVSQAAGTASIGSTVPCPSDLALQDPGVTDTSSGKHQREGILVWRAAGVSIENLSVCNSMENEIWWNQGDGTGNQQPMAFHGDYLTTTSTFYNGPSTPSAQYGIFTSDVLGPGIVDHSYANNMTDAAYYIGACRNCNTVLEHPHAENSALGLSSTNSGGNLIIENGEWNNNRTGLVSNAQNNDDFPSPQYGQCVDSAPPPGAGPNSCYVIRGNRIHDNNNPNTPGVGLTAVSAIGTGVELAATQHISVLNNQIYNQGSWGVVTHDFPDPENGPAACNGGIPVPPVFSDPSQVTLCTWFSLGNFVGNNQFWSNGGFNATTNGDIANQAPGTAKAPSDTVGTVPDPNCFKGNQNLDPGNQLKEWPPGPGPTGLQEAPCPPSAFETPLLTAELVCATGAASLFTMGQVNQDCPDPAKYPKHNGVCGANEVLTPKNNKDIGGVLPPPELHAQLSPLTDDAGPLRRRAGQRLVPGGGDGHAEPSPSQHRSGVASTAWGRVRRPRSPRRDRRHQGGPAPPPLARLARGQPGAGQLLWRQC